MRELGQGKRENKVLKRGNKNRKSIKRKVLTTVAPGRSLEKEVAMTVAKENSVVAIASECGGALRTRGSACALHELPITGGLLVN